jgi:hypothetical protein
MIARQMRAHPQFVIFFRVAALSVAVLLPTGCSTVGNAAKSAYRSAYYATVETFGVHKRDILKKKVVQARDDQHEAEEEFKDALTRLREVYSVDGGELEKQYDQLKGQYETAAGKAADVKSRITSIETVAGDLFKEWERELEEIKTVKLKVASRKKLLETQSRYNELVGALKKSESGMASVLEKFKEHVLFLKHNLNAVAIASLKGEAVNIQDEIAQLISDMQASIKIADRLIQDL